ncbi:retrovirus-related pol polyprotein from transposon TNT 1-94 [Tanacetum coccineum]|uniref:Retrovirus-related pol polyprotein from transposon TNT 1-94 n=1 Tax=Tanacetum coccineum TaxID=301880 RepID=A0ABQ4YLB6_9ASTR
MSKVLQERGFRSLPSSTETNPRDYVKSSLTTVEADMTPIRPNSYGASHIDNSIPRKEKDPGSFILPCYINNVCFDNSLADLGASVNVMPLSTYLNLGLDKLAHTKLMVELVDRIMKYPKGIAENVLVGIGRFVFPVDFIILDMPEDVKVPLILRRPFLSTAHAKIDVFKRKITLRVGDEKIIFKRVYMLGLREHRNLDLNLGYGENLVLNRSLDLLYGDYIELNDLNIPLELRRDQVDDLIPTIEEGEVIDEPMIDIIKTRNNENFDENPGAKSGLKRKQSSKHTYESQTEASKSKAGHLVKENLSSLVKDKSPSHPSAHTHVVVEMHKESQQAAGGPTSLEATRNDVLADSTVEADPGISNPNDSIPHP